MAMDEWERRMKDPRPLYEDTGGDVTDGRPKISPDSSTSNESNAFPRPLAVRDPHVVQGEEFGSYGDKMERLGAAHRIITGRPLDASTQDVEVAKRLRAGGSPGQLRDVHAEEVLSQRRASNKRWMDEMMERYGPGGI